MTNNTNHPQRGLFPDWLDNYIFGPLNLIDRLEGMFWGATYGDMGRTFKIKYHDRGGKHSRRDIINMLKEYGVATYWHTHDADHMYFRTKKRQANWAEHIMLKAGVAIVSEPYNAKNIGYAAMNPMMPVSWESKREARQPKRKRRWWQI